MGGRRLAAAALAALAAALLAAPAANADFHFISIREVHPGSTTYPDSAYIVLQAYTSGQHFVYNHAVTTHAANGSTTGTFTFPGNVSNGADQMTILVGDTGVSSAFSVAPDLTNAGFSLSPTGGAVCWAGSTDCMSWGNFSGSISGTGSPAAPSGITDGMALRRTIQPNCSTLLEAADDSNDSATDFFSATPTPRNNSSAITETDCTGPTVVIDTKPANPTNSTSASFTYHSVPAGASFECRLDTASFTSCPSTGITYPGPLSDGNHSFQVRGKNTSEQVGTPATYGWRVDTIAPTATIDTKPADPSHGGSVQFKYHASESGSSFECSLAAGAAPDSFASCPSSGKSYNNLPDGEHTFKVRAEDPAGNTGAPAAHTWIVDNSLTDTTPPDTVIDSAPPDPTTSSTVSFTYHSTEPGSSFECKLDAGAYAGCPAAGVTYSGLANGSHTFLVRAIDASENVDPTPAGRSFDVAVPPPPPAPPPPPPPPLVAPAIPTPPDTTLTKRPPRVTRDRTPTVRFGSNVPGARFQCSVDRGRFRPCRSPFTTNRLKFGRHRIRVRAIAGGAVDPTPAVSSFKVAKPRRNNQRARKGKKRRQRRAGARSHRGSLGGRG